MLVRLFVVVLGSSFCCLTLACDDFLSPIGTLEGKLAYTEPGRIHVLDLETQQDDLIYTAQTGTDIKSLTWYPDGTSLVFHTYAFGQHTQFIQEWKMYSISAGGTGMSLMFDRVGPETYPAYGPDGRLAYWGENGLYIDGRVTYTSGGVADLSAPSWAPDGEHIAFAAASELVVLSLADTSQSQNILENSQVQSAVRDPVFSPDGGQIAFVRELNANLSEIWLINVDGTDERAITQDHVDRHPVWSEDGTTIVFVRNENSVYTIDTDPGGRVQILLSHAVDYIAWAW